MHLNFYNYYLINIKKNIEKSRKEKLLQIKHAFSCAHKARLLFSAKKTLIIHKTKKYYNTVNVFVKEWYFFMFFLEAKKHFSTYKLGKMVRIEN